MMLAKVFARGNEKAGRPARRIADDIFWPRRGQFDHELNDVPRRAELTVLPGRGDLAEHVLVEISLRVALVHRHVVNQIDHFRQ